jgi:rare lipoprotein A
MKTPLLVLFLSSLLLSAAAAFEEEGIASWYGGKFQGRRTANGEIFDTNKLTAAHKTLPFNTLVKVHNPQNGKSVVVRINDRGPFVEGRIIDLSRAAADSIGIAGLGVAPVRISLYQAGHEDGEREQSIHKAEELPVYVIQVAAYSQSSNLNRTIRLLKESGFEPKIEITLNNIHRVILTGIPLSDVQDYKTRLGRIGFPDVLLRHD